ncbi:hypothetical protein G4L39_07865 [Limisphaera ngatamarikiensis]|uniref:Pectate lyase n=1 Tax=Limisphaera ngatamarikiensis TaxID=1324935 RepID=A0A6M1RVC9_9BACT|nr:hypothetical protein [Limisphaera ngatamarikiensis]
MLLGWLVVWTAWMAPGQTAFPGAVGAGAYARGGRGGDVYYVTNLADYVSSSDPRRFGTLRYGIASATGPRTIVFAVSGTITLSNDLVVNKSFLTIAGQTAPGDGITLRRRTLRIQDARDVVVRYIRVRPGDMDPTFQGDAVWVVRATNVVLDHLSTSWSVDECLSVTHSTQVTVQHCWIAESLNVSQHDKGAHGYGSLLRYGDGRLTFFGNLYAHHNSRNPRLGDRLRLEFVNNVVYNWGSRAGHSGADDADNPGGFTNWLAYLGNVLVAGPSTQTPRTAFQGGATNTWIHQAGNWIDSNRNGRWDGADTGWGMFGGQYTRLQAWPWPLEVPVMDAGGAFLQVAVRGGASQARDAVDSRILRTLQTQTGRLVDAVGEPTQPEDNEVRNVNGMNLIFVRGWPELRTETAPVDTDLDGMPDFWELALGLNPNDARDRNRVGPEGYTALEDYLNWRAGWHRVCPRNGFIEIDLDELARGWTGLVWQVQAGTNGSVELLEDGGRVRFVATRGYSGLASFTVSATDPLTGWRMGPETVSVLVSITNAPNQPPVLDPIPPQEITAGQTLELAFRATDPDLPLQQLRFALAGETWGATVDAETGVLRWRVPVALGGTTCWLTVVVSDDGEPALSATQTVQVVVRPVSPPRLGVTRDADGGWVLSVEGVPGPDYILQVSEDLQLWRDVVWTNPPTWPWIWREETPAGTTRRFYRVRLAP